jgi:hypothetical protein
VISRAEYEALLEDRPDKFGPDEVGYMEESESPEVCCSCIHFFTNPTRMTNVCEVLRLEDDSNIPPLARCRFWTTDGSHYPLLGVK